MAVMLDLLLASPGETRESLVRTVDLMKQADADRGGRLRRCPPLSRHRTLRAPSFAADFFIEPAVAPFVFPLLDSLIGGDRRFLFFDPSHPDRNYNYNANQRLIDAIAQGTAAPTGTFCGAANTHLPRFYNVLPTQEAPCPTLSPLS